MNIRKVIKNMLFNMPYSVNKFFRYDIYRPYDFIKNSLAKDDQINPPESLLRFGGYSSNTSDIGNSFLAFLLDKSVITNRDNYILDIGCGVGLLGIPILGYLDADNGYYDGLDIIKESINWCDENIAKKYRNSKFHRLDVFNASYNPMGKFKGETYRLPFDENKFDAVIMKSVATHMRPIEVQNYLKQISRVLKINGKCLITFFVLDDTAMNLVQGGRSSYKFLYEYQGCLITNPKIPEDAIAYKFEILKQFYYGAGLKIGKIYYGNWSSRCDIDQSITGQDIIIAQKL